VRTARRSANRGGSGVCTPRLRRPVEKAKAAQEGKHG